MNSGLKAPQNIMAAGGDCSADISWDPVEGASAYKLLIYDAAKPAERIRSLYSKSCSKSIADLTNGVTYLVSVCALTYLGKVEIPGETSEKAPFVPVSLHLKAQKTICLTTGGSAQIRWEYRNQVPRAEFVSDNESIATVSSSGKVTAVSAGVAHITVKAKGEEFRTRVAVDRKLHLERGRAVLMFAGDLMCTARHQELTEKYSYDFGHAFKDIRKTLAPADFSAAVLGTSCYDSAAYESEQPKLPNGNINRNSPSTFLSAVANAGFDGLVTATGNCCTGGRKGLVSTVTSLTALGMKNIGTLGTNPVYINIKGIRLALIAASSIDTGASDANSEKRALIGQFTRDGFAELLKTARAKGSDYIIVYRCRAVESADEISNMSAEAQFIADCGADLILGTYPTGPRKFRKLTAADGRRVHCAFSLGSMLSTSSNSVKNGVILRAEVQKDENGKITADFSYIPCRSEERPSGIEVKPVYPCCSENGKKALADISETLGKEISLFGRKPRVLINGSLILENIFSSDRRFKLDKAGLLISPLSVCGKPDYEFSEKDGGYAAVDICKTLPTHIEETSPDFIAVDFYTAAGLSCYRLRDNLFTGTKTFTSSVFYNFNKDVIERLRPPISEEVWKPHIREYAEMLLKSFRPERIVLFRHRFPGKVLRDGTIRSTVVSPWLNGSIGAMEEYFMSLVSPSVVDISDGYFTAGSQLSDFEDEYFADAYRAFCEIALEGRRYEYLPDIELRFNRILTVYDSIAARGHFDWLLKFDCAADQIIAHTSKQFAAANSERIIRLKKAGRSDLSCVRDFFEDDPCAGPLINAAEIIDSVLKGDLSHPYEFYLPAFTGKFNILKKMATLLSVEIGQPVDEQDAELVFLMRGKPQLDKYIANTISSTVDIWGSSISRESLKLADGVHIGNQIYQQPPVLAFEPAVLTKFTEDLRQFGGSARKRLTITNALMRTGMDVVNESKSKWLILDLYDLIGAMADYDGDIFEIDESTIKTGFYKGIRNECTECTLLDTFGSEECIARLDRFAAEVLDKYGDNIILVRSEPKKRKKHTAEEVARIEKNRSFLAMCEESFIAGTRCYVINIAERFNEVEQVSAKITRTIHYEKEFYRQCGRYITDIVRGTDRKIFNKVDENYMLLRAVKSKKRKQQT